MVGQKNPLHCQIAAKYVVQNVCESYIKLNSRDTNSNYSLFIQSLSADLETALKAEFDIPKEADCRVWHRYMTHTYELLSTPSQTLQDAGLYNGQVRRQ